MEHEIRTTVLAKSTEPKHNLELFAEAERHLLDRLGEVMIAEEPLHNS